MLFNVAAMLKFPQNEQEDQHIQDMLQDQVQIVLICEMVFADDVALAAHTETQL